jgi:hypothetical protein
MFYSYTGSEHKKIYPIGYTPNKCSKFLLLSLKSFVAEKRHVAMQKLFIKKRDKKRKRKVLEKNGQVSDISKTMGSQMPS